MKKHVKLIAVIAPIGILSVFLTIAVSLTGCYKTELFIPDYIQLEAAPVETTVEELLADYLTDEEAADAKYNGKRLLFYGVLVEEARSYYPHGQYHEDPMPDDIKGTEYYMFTTGSVLFNPKDPVYLYGVVPGSIVDVVGVCQGLSGDIIIISDSWIQIAGGEASGPVDY